MWGWLRKLLGFGSGDSSVRTITPAEVRAFRAPWAAEDDYLDDLIPMPHNVVTPSPPASYNCQHLPEQVTIQPYYRPTPFSVGAAGADTMNGGQLQPCNLYRCAKCSRIWYESGGVFEEKVTPASLARNGPDPQDKTGDLTLNSLLDKIRSALMEVIASPDAADPKRRQLVIYGVPGDEVMQNLMALKGGKFTLVIQEVPRGVLPDAPPVEETFEKPDWLK